jgi:hypothetical protein
MSLKQNLTKTSLPLKITEVHQLGFKFLTEWTSPVVYQTLSLCFAIECSNQKGNKYGIIRKQCM